MLWSLNTTCPTASLASSGSLCSPYCLFNLTQDVAEAHDLAQAEDAEERKKWDTLAQKMLKRLEHHGSTGGPHAFLWDTKTYQHKRDDLCAATVDSGVLEPLDCSGVTIV